MQNARTALVTGASTGIGAACVEYLLERGHRVFGSVRQQADADALRDRTHGKAEALLLDVTDEDAIHRAAERLTTTLGEQGLDGLVNNAGIAVAGPLEFVAIHDWRRQLEVNVIGHVAVTQAFLPLLRKARGRIVFMGSVSGRMAVPFLGPYAASKYALEAITDALRRELRPWGMHVAVIEPGVVKTPIWDKSVQAGNEFAASLPPTGRALYGDMLASMKAMISKLARRGAPPVAVAKAVAHALTSTRPKTRYVVGTDAKIQARLLPLIPDRIADALISKAMHLRGANDDSPPT